jgi:predicted nucleic acid-binding protein
MIRAVLADSGPLFAAVDEGDEHHVEALRQLQNLDQDKRIIIIPYPIVLEAYSLVVKRLGAVAAQKWITAVTASTLINPDTEDYGRAMVMVRDYPDQRITLFDATLAALSLRLGLEVWTYDHHFDVMRVPVWR